MKMSSVIVKPIASPAIAGKTPRGSAAHGEDHPDQEESQDGLDHDSPAGADSRSERRRAEVDGIDSRLRKHGAQQERGEDGRDDLREPVGRREHGLDPPRDEEAERDRRVEVPAGDVADRRGHHADHEAVRERDRGQIGPVRGDDRAGTDEDERECADELRDTALKGGRTHAADLRNHTGWSEKRSFEGWGEPALRPTM